LTKLIPGILGKKSDTLFSYVSNEIFQETSLSPQGHNSSFVY